jgi:hypothetical protein
MTRSYNTYIGVDISIKYDEVLYSEDFPPTPLEDVNVYVQKALAERAEIVSIKRQLELLHLQLEALETNRIHEVYTSAQKEYKDALHSIDTYEANLQKTCLEIEKEIKKAYAGIINEIRNVENLSDMLTLQRDNYERMKRSYELGLVSKNVFTQTEISLKQTENSCRLAVYSLNTMLMKFEYACCAGPGYR